MPLATGFTKETIRDPEAEQAAEERWVQSELSKDPRLAALRILYNDIRTEREIKPETWDYFDKQEMTGGAESLSTKHITTLTGTYDPDTGELVAAMAGGERVTFDSFMENGLGSSMLRAAEKPHLAFQVGRDQIYYDNYNGSVKDMWRGETDYDTVMYVSTFPEELLSQGADGQNAINELAYDAKDKKAFVHIFRRTGDVDFDFAAIRLGTGLKAPFARYLQGHGINESAFEGKESHEYGSFVVKTITAGEDIINLASHEAGLFDDALLAETGELHWFGQKEDNIDAYQLFKQTPEMWEAYREYHSLLAKHLAGWPLDDKLYDYLVTLHDSVGAHVLDDTERVRLGVQLDGNKITVDMALACKKIMTYSHYATLDRLLAEFKATGKVTDLNGDDMLRAYGSAAGGNGGDAAARGETFNDCESTYGTMSAVAEMAAQLGISIEEAMRRLQQKFAKPELFTHGQCGNCERETKIWKQEDGGCNICKACADAHTAGSRVGGEAGGNAALKRERNNAMREKQLELAVLSKYHQEAVDFAEAEKSTDEISLGEVRYVEGRKQVYMRWLSTGSATNMWVEVATGKVSDE